MCTPYFRRLAIEEPQLRAFRSFFGTIRVDTKLTNPTTGMFSVPDHAVVNGAGTIRAPGARLDPRTDPGKTHRPIYKMQAISVPASAQAESELLHALQKHCELRH